MRWSKKNLIILLSRQKTSRYDVHTCIIKVMMNDEDFYQYINIFIEGEREREREREEVVEGLRLGYTFH